MSFQKVYSHVMKILRMIRRWKCSIYCIYILLVEHVHSLSCLPLENSLIFLDTWHTVYIFSLGLSSFLIFWIYGKSQLMKCQYPENLSSYSAQSFPFNHTYGRLKGTTVSIGPVVNCNKNNKVRKWSIATSNKFLVLGRRLHCFSKH